MSYFLSSTSCYLVACRRVVLDDRRTVDCHVMLADGQVRTIMLVQLNHQPVVLQLQRLNSNNNTNEFYNYPS